MVATLDRPAQAAGSRFLVLTSHSSCLCRGTKTRGWQCQAPKQTHTESGALHVPRAPPQPQPTPRDLAGGGKSPLTVSVRTSERSQRHSAGVAVIRHPRWAPLGNNVETGPGKAPGFRVHHPQDAQSSTPHTNCRAPQRPPGLWRLRRRRAHSTGT